MSNVIDLAAERMARRPSSLFACSYCEDHPILRDIGAALRCDECGHVWPAWSTDG